MTEKRVTRLGIDNPRVELLAAGAIALLLLIAGVVVYFIATRGFKLNDEQLKSIGAITASLAAGAWVVLYAFFTGTPYFERLKLARERENYVPRIEIDWSIIALEPKAGSTRVPVSIYVAAKNNGTRSVNSLDYSGVPLLLMAAVDYEDALRPQFSQTISLPYTKISAPTVDADVTISTWKNGALQPGDVEHFAFLHPGLEPGTYLVQFQLPIPEELTILKRAGVMWTRMTYVAITRAGQLLMPTISGGRTREPQGSGVERAA